jgi:pyrroloquinoline-quinone synthase
MKHFLNPYQEASMEFSKQLQTYVAPYNLLSHPFYQAWMKGELSQSTLQDYTLQYFPHVKAFPRYVSTLHGLCEDDQGRKMLLENLNDEEGFRSGVDHPQLWKNFGEGLGVAAEKFESVAVREKAQNLVDTYWELCRSSFAEGLAALYVYEQQIPEIAQAKIEGLKKNYAISDAKTLAFFAEHETADKYHSEACAQLLNNLSCEEKELALQAGKKASVALWDFLSEVHGAPCAH